MVDYPILRFVANAGDTTARLDLNDGDIWTVNQENFSLGAPAYEADAFAVGALYDLRTVTFTPRVTGGPSAVFPALSALAVELQRNRNWLMFQFDATSKPYWLRTYKSELTALTLEDVYVSRPSSSWERPVTLRCDPFALEQQVTLPTIQINNDPAGSEANKTAYVLPSIEGDAPAPLNVHLEALTTVIDAIRAPMIATSAVDTAYTPPLVVTEWTYAILNGQPEVVIDAGYVAGQRIDVPGDWDLNATITPPFAGRYKTYLRCGFSDSTTEWDLDCGGGNVRVTQRSIGNENTEPWLWWGGVGTQGWIDMGVVALGDGWSEMLNPSLETTVQLKIRKISGAGEIRIDSIMFIPVDDDDFGVEARTLRIDPFLVPSGASVRYYADGERRRLWGAYDTGSGWQRMELGGLSGRFPQLVPGRQNVLHLLRNVDTGEDVKGNDTAVTVSYFPRRLDPLGTA